MKISVSNIAWKKVQDSYFYTVMEELGYLGLEIAPTRLFPTNPYDKLKEAKKWAESLMDGHGLRVSSMQSIWFGRQEKIFGNDEERKVLLNYTKKAIDFAEIIGCSNVVFGCPKNRSIPDGADVEIVMNFFKEIGDYANDHHTVVALEGNPVIYGTNFLNTTKETLDFIEQVESKGLLLNLDIGTMIENEEDISLLNGKEHLIHHVHISEPGLKPIQERKLHKELASFLKKINYQRFVSIEVGSQNKIQELTHMMEYVANVFL